MTFGSADVGRRIKIVTKGFESDDNTAFEATVVGIAQGNAGHRTLTVAPARGNGPLNIREDQHDIFSISP